MNRDINNELNLTSLNSGEVGYLLEIRCKGKAKKRLLELGFMTGSKIRMLKNDKGPVIFFLLGKKWTIGRGLASQIIVTYEHRDN